jgi:hypothetical protein
MEKITSLTITVMLEATDTGYSAYIGQYPVYAVGNDIPDTLKNVGDGLEFYLRERDKKQPDIKKGA